LLVTQQGSDHDAIEREFPLLHKPFTALELTGAIEALACRSSCDRVCPSTSAVAVTAYRLIAFVQRPCRLARLRPNRSHISGAIAPRSSVLASAHERLRQAAPTPLSPPPSRMREMIAEVEHEIKMRREVASRQVSTGRMADETALRRIAIRETVAAIRRDLQGP
jgi:hypothetical protein